MKTDKKRSAPHEGGADKQNRTTNNMDTKIGSSKEKRPHIVALNSACFCENFAGIDGVLAQFTGTHWKLLKTDYEVNEAGKEIIEIINSRTNYKLTPDIKTLPKVTKQIATTNSRTSLGREYINFKDCAINLATGKKIKDRHGLAITYVLPYNSGNGKKPEKFLKFLSEVVPNADQRDFLLNIIASCLLTKEQIPSVEYMTYLVGSGSNGKSTLLWVLEGVLGTDNVSQVTLDKSPEEYYNSMMEGKLLNIATETGKFIDPSREKKLASREAVVGRDPYGKARNIYLLPVQIAALNERPVNTEHTHAVARKRIIIDFPVRFTDHGTNGSLKKDPHLRHKLTGEFGGILGLLIKRAEIILKDGCIKTPLSMLQSLNTQS